MSPRLLLIGLALACVAGIVGVAAAIYWRPLGAPAELVAGTSLRPRRPVPDFSLIDENGKTFGSANLKGTWSMMFFGYTNCPDFCPTTLTLLAAMNKRLRADVPSLRPRVIFMSVDAKRDTPAQLAKYVPYFDPEFIGLTAPDQTTAEAVAAKLGASVVITPTKDGGYTVDHSGEIFVIDPAGKLAAILTGPFTVDELTTDFKRVAGRS
jgi:protein SCO1/2